MLKIKLVLKLFHSRCSKWETRTGGRYSDKRKLIPEALQSIRMRASTTGLCTPSISESVTHEWNPCSVAGSAVNLAANWWRMQFSDSFLKGQGDHPGITLKTDPQAWCSSAAAIGAPRGGCVCVSVCLSVCWWGGGGVAVLK